MKRPATAEDILDLERCEVVGGEIVEKAGPGGEHACAQFVIAHSLGPFFGRGGSGPGGWWIGTECTIELERHEVYVPDVVGWRIERCPERPRGNPVRIVPDWVCEILSPSTAARDMGAKQAGYHRARVGHIWIVDPQNLIVTAHRWGEDGYLVCKVAGPGEQLRAEPFEEVEIDVSALFGL